MTAEKKDRKPLRIKNLADLKRHIRLGTELVATAHQYHPDIVGLTRVVTKVQTNGFYSKIKDQPDHKWSTCNHGLGFWSPFNKAGAYRFTDSTVQVLNTRKNDGSIGIPVDEYAVTDTSGVATFSNILIGTGYTLEEVDTPIRYVVPDNQTAAIEWNKVTNKSFDNVLKKWNLTVTKQDVETGSAQGDANLAGAKYGIYKGDELIDTYLHERLEYEQNPKVRKLIKKDIEFLDNVQVEMATARQFLFTARIKASKDKQVFDTANRVEKIISEQGFEVRRMRKADIKRFLALYFEASMNGEQMPDIDGEQFYEVDEDEEDEA